jgi:hypothetical protein
MDDQNHIYKISYVVLGGSHHGAIINASRRPTVGEIVDLGNKKFKILEIVDLMPSRGRFHYLHVTCEPVD